MAVTPSAQYSVTLRIETDPRDHGTFSRLATAIGAIGGDIGAVDLVSTARHTVVREIVVNARDIGHAEEILGGRAGAGRHHGARQLGPDLPAASRRQDRAVRAAAARDARRPLTGLHARGRARCARPSPTIATRSSTTRSSATWSRWSPTARRCSAWATSAPLGALPVMEGKSMLFKEFADVDAFPICVDSHEPKQIVEIGVRSRRCSAGSTSRTFSARLLRDRGPAQRAPRYPGVPRRPARHGRRRARGADQRLHGRRQADRGPQGRRVGRRRRGRGRDVKILLSAGVRERHRCDPEAPSTAGRP